MASVVLADSKVYLLLHHPGKLPVRVEQADKELHLLLHPVRLLLRVEQAQTVLATAVREVLLLVQRLHKLLLQEVLVLEAKAEAKGQAAAQLLTVSPHSGRQAAGQALPATMQKENPQ